jgi:tetratricopeptide (TPR) repeat protein
VDRARPIVFVAMPFGKKPDQTRSCVIDFDRIYEQGIRPAVARFPLDVIRADEERSGGVIHKPMFERLLLAEIAIVDATTQNANVFYELGVRHAARPRSTIIVSASEGALPFDIAMIRTVPYTLENGTLTDENAAAFADALAGRLEAALADLQGGDDSPLFQLIPKFPGIELPHEVCEGFRDRARYVDGIRDRLAALRDLDAETALAKIREIEDEIAQSSPGNAELAMELILGYRGLNVRAGWEGVVRVFEALPASARDNGVTLREQYALGLNRLYAFTKGDERQRALKILQSIVEARGDSPETCALIGRIYKDQYAEALAAGQRIKADGFLQQAIEWYARGFNADPRDYYPGVNAATLLAIANTDEAKATLHRLVPAVSFAVARLGGIKSSDYWQVATVLELAVLGGEWNEASRALARMLTLNPDAMQCATTANNLRLYRQLYTSDDAARVAEMIEALEGQRSTRAEGEVP